MAAMSTYAQNSSGSITGLVQDSAGIPQMGALIQLLAPDATLAATAITDIHGRYHLAHLLPGNYQVRASAALFEPASRPNLHLIRGGRMIVNLTMSALFEPSTWLPAQRRTASDPGDDWMWTLRSSANRPMLRLASQGQVIAVSSSSTEVKRATSKARADVISGDGGFGKGGLHNIFTLDHDQVDGSGTILRANISGPRSPYPVGPSTEITAGIERESGFNGYSRVSMTYYSHLELVSRPGTTGMQGALLRSAERIQLGDTVRVEAGSALTDVNMGGNAIAMQPFARVEVKPSDSMVLSYGYATSRDLQEMGDIDDLSPTLPVAVMQNGHLALEKATHQEITLAAKAAHGTLQLTLYHDRMKTPMLSGSGLLSAREVDAGGFVVDPTTATFRALGPGYSSTGWSVSFVEPITSSLSLTAIYEDGQAIVATEDMQHENLDEAVAGLRPQYARSATIAVKGRVLKTGTKLRTAYRWQSGNTLTPVNAFRAGSDRAYLGVYIRQPIRLGHALPRGFEAVLDVTNLLAEGYQPFMSSDGHTLFFAQAPRTLQAGVAFNF